jgi:hypothetical protein
VGGRCRLVDNIVKMASPEEHLGVKGQVNTWRQIEALLAIKLNALPP